MIDRFVDSTDAVQVAVYELNPESDASAPVILFCHATGFHGQVWKLIAQELPEFRCVALDFRFHGDTVTPSGTSHDWTGLAADVMAVADSIDAAPMLAVGWSLGGAAIVGAAVRRPDLFRAAMLFEPILFPQEFASLGGPDGKNPMSDAAIRRRATFPSFDAVYERYRSRPPFDGIAPEALRIYVEEGFRLTKDGEVTLKCTPADEAAMFNGWMTNELYRLPEVDMPIEVAGSSDGRPPANFAEEIARIAPNGKYLLFDELTHFGPLEDPSRIAVAVCRLAASV